MQYDTQRGHTANILYDPLWSEYTRQNFILNYAMWLLIVQ